MMLFRHAHPASAFMWEGAEQPTARWHVRGDGPVQYFATTADGAWAELLRHEEIVDPEDLMGISDRAMWVVEADELSLVRPMLDAAVLTGGLDSYAQCQLEAARLRQAGSPGLIAPSAALIAGAARSYYVDEGQRYEVGPSEVVALFGKRPDLRGQLVAIGRPDPLILERVRPL